MDMIERKNAAMIYIRKHRMVLIALLTGVALMLLPEKPKQEELPQVVQEEKSPDLEGALEEILSLIQGAGNVRVLLTEAEGEKTIYQINENERFLSSQRPSLLRLSLLQGLVPSILATITARITMQSERFCRKARRGGKNLTAPSFLNPKEQPRD